MVLKKEIPDLIRPANAIFFVVVADNLIRTLANDKSSIQSIEKKTGQRRKVT